MHASRTRSKSAKKTPRAIFVSDAHLAFPEDDNYRKMLKFLGGLSGLPDLFILGDLFAFWMGFDRPPQRFVPFVDALSALVRQGTRLHWVEGNHDIDVGRFFARQLGATVYPEKAEIRLGGKRLLIAHGDTVDQCDTAYRRLRWLLRSPVLKGMSHGLSPEAVLKVADRFTIGKHYQVDHATHLPDLMREFARKRWAEGYDGVLMGHCHQPEFTHGKVGGRTCFYANIGDWMRHFTYVVLDEGGFSQQHYRPA